MVALESTGAFVFALIMAVSQFVEPLSSSKVDEIVGKAQLSSEARAVYEFQPLTLQQLETLNNEELAIYLRTACTRIRNQAILTEESFNKGKLIELTVLNMIANGVDVVSLKQLQSRLLPEEEFDAELAVRYFVKACEDKDERFPLDVLTYYDLSGAVQKYKDFAEQLPHWKSLDDLPLLPELIQIQNQKGENLGELYKIDTLTENGKVEVVRKNRRINLSEGEVPELMMKALVSIEDSRFWNFEPEGSEDYKGHRGFDFKGALRAGNSTASGGDVQGGSTITMQLVKNYVLYNDVFREHSLGKRSMYRKLREVILARNLEEVLSKRQILTLYLNTIDFGRQSQGLAMAAKAYFNKNVGELELHEMTLLAALPKGPSYYNPDKNPEKLLQRRNYVLSRMASEGYITSQEAEQAKAKPLSVVEAHLENLMVKGYSHFYLSEIQNQVFQERKDQSPFASQAHKPVKAFMDEALQEYAVKALQEGLVDYEKSMGRFAVRPRFDQLPNIKDLVEKASVEKGEDPTSVYPSVLSQVPHPYEDGRHFIKAVILDSSTYGLEDGSTAKVNKEDKKQFVKEVLINGKFEKQPLEKWDVVLVDPHEGDYRLVSFTEVQGAIVIIENWTGNVLATSGGFSVGKNNRYMGPLGNRAFHAFRQPGSTIKPFLYLKAIHEGVSKDMSIANTSIVFPQRFIDGQRHCNRWNPQAYSTKEQSTLTVGEALATSKNLAAGHLFNYISGDYRSTYAPGGLYIENPDRYTNYTPLSDQLDRLWSLYLHFGIYEGWPEVGPCYSVILGSKETTVARMAGAYAMLANGGIPVRPTLYEGQYNNEPLQRPDVQIDGYAFNEIRGLLQNVLRYGTATRIKKWADVVFGKTGTSNNNKDAWFVGSTNEITVAVWVGYPDGKLLGRSGTGGRAALPVFQNFMERYFADRDKTNLVQENVSPEIVESEEENLPLVSSLDPNTLVEPMSGVILTQDVMDLFYTRTGQSILTIPSVKIGEIKISPIYFDDDPSNKEFWRVVFEYLSLEKLKLVKESYRGFYKQELSEIQHYDSLCLESGNQGSSCLQRDALMKELTPVFEFYYLNRYYF
ncbi:MAG: transglycosylase domain-containing protein [Bdellovibrionales bacterium]|nr:transglycosylase domain-containing protein [Bdellovibrionales bacterium]